MLQVWHIAACGTGVIGNVVGAELPHRMPVDCANQRRDRRWPVLRSGVGQLLTSSQLTVMNFVHDSGVPWG